MTKLKAGTLGWSDPVSHDCGSFVECGPTMVPHSPAYCCKIQIENERSFTSPELACFKKQATCRATFKRLCAFHSVFMQSVCTFAILLCSCVWPPQIMASLETVACTLSKFCISVDFVICVFMVTESCAHALGRVERQVQNHHHSGTSNQRCRHSWGVLKPHFSSLAQLRNLTLSLSLWPQNLSGCLKRKAGQWRLVKIGSVYPLRTKCRVGKRCQWSRHVHTGMEN